MRLCAPVDVSPHDDDDDDDILKKIDFAAFLSMGIFILLAFSHYGWAL